MAGDQFRIEELNPFLEWHLHTTATSLEVASEEAKRIAKMIGRKTRVLSEDGEVLTEVNPWEYRHCGGTHEGISPSAAVSNACKRSTTALGLRSNQ